MVPLKNLISQDTFPGPAMIPDSNVVKYCFGNCDIYYLCSSTCWFVILTLLRSGKPLTRLFRFTAGKAWSELEGSGYFHLSKRYIDMLLFAITFFGIFISYLNLFETNEQSANYVMIATKSYFLYWKLASCLKMSLDNRRISVYLTL